MAARKLPPIREGIPAPTTPEGQIFHYQPTEAVLWLPFTARNLADRAHAREVPHVNNGNKIWFTGRQICAISEQFTVDVLPEHQRPSAPEPHGRPRRPRTSAA